MTRIVGMWRPRRHWCGAMMTAVMPGGGYGCPYCDRPVGAVMKVAHRVNATSVADVAAEDGVSESAVRRAADEGQRYIDEYEREQAEWMKSKGWVAIPIGADEVPYDD